jgi:transcriptional regulator with XRE-family HTH domain
MGISQEALAERAGLHRTYVADIERGARNLALENIEKLAVALEISISDLFAKYGVDPL